MHIGDHLANDDVQKMYDFITSFPESERGGVFVLVTEEERIISNYSGEAQNWELKPVVGVSWNELPIADEPGGGTTGSTGTSGTTGGTTGASGTTGTSGTSGTSGSTSGSTTGTSGTSGTTSSTTGTSGSKSGTTGSTSGTTGEPGEPGQCIHDDFVGEPGESSGYGEGYQTTQQFGMPPSNASSALRSAFFAGIDTGIFHRIRTKINYRALSGAALLPGLSDLHRNENINEVVYHYLGIDSINGGTGSAEGGFFFDWKKPDQCNFLPWKPYVRFHWGGQDTNVVQIEQVQDLDHRDKIFLAPGSSSQVKLTTITGGVAYRFTYDRTSVGSSSLAIGFLRSDSTWNNTGVGIKFRLISGLAAPNSYNYRTNSGTRACNLGWTGLIISPLNQQPRFLQTSDFQEILNYYGQDPYGPTISPNPPNTIVPNTNAIRVNANLYGETRSISVRLDQ